MITMLRVPELARMTCCMLQMRRFQNRVQLTMLLGPWAEYFGLLKGLPGGLLVMVVCAWLIRALLRFKRWHDETPHAKAFFTAFGALLVCLLVDNAFIWYVSATDVNKWGYQDPLQDNVGIVLTWLARRHPWTEVLWRWEFINIKWLLISVVMLGLSPLFNQVQYSGFAMMTRVAACVAICRMIRTVGFMLTVLPSMRPGCYRTRFPAVPGSAWETLWLGFSKLRGSGGCNDLIISGHATIYTMAPLAFSRFYPGWTPALLWVAVVRTCLRGPWTRQHYSIDMAMAVLISSLVFYLMPMPRKVMEEHFARRVDPKGPLVRLLTGCIVAVLLALAFIIVHSGA